MQTPKSRNSSSGAPQRTSPESCQKVSPRVCKLKTSARYTEPTACSSNLSKERCPKEVDRKSPKTPVPEKKHPNKATELESQISQLENDLERVKDLLHSSEESKNQAHKDAEESNQKLLALSTKLEESQKKILDEHSDSNDSAALYEIKRLKLELEMSELNKLNEKLGETTLLLEEMKHQLKDSKESETRAHKIVGETLMQLEIAKKMVENLKSDGCKATEAYDTIATELDQSRARVEFLEGLVTKLKAESRNEIVEENEGESMDEMKLEVERLRLALGDSEMRYNEEKKRAKNALETVEKIKSESGMREAELEAELRKSKYEIDEWRANLIDKENELQGVCEENDDLTMQLENELEKSRARIENLRARLADKENENEKLKTEINETGKGKDDILRQLEYMSDEVDKSKRKTARVEEQLEATQRANGEMESELRKLKVQLDQWRKAAEAAAAMLSVGHNGQFVEKTGSMDSDYSPRIGYNGDIDEDLLKKKNGNVLRRLWKKPHK